MAIRYVNKVTFFKKLCYVAPNLSVFVGTNGTVSGLHFAKFCEDRKFTN